MMIASVLSPDAHLYAANWTAAQPTRQKNSPQVRTALGGRAVHDALLP